MNKLVPIQKLPPPEMPKEWNYDKSVKKTKTFIYKWKNLTIEILNELYIARDKLSKTPKEAGKMGANKRWHGANAPR